MTRLDRVRQVTKGQCACLRDRVSLVDDWIEFRNLRSVIVQNLCLAKCQSLRVMMRRYVLEADLVIVIQSVSSCRSLVYQLRMALNVNHRTTSTIRLPK
jgi:hypothetical protein